jgi:hypothetical protein
MTYSNCICRHCGKVGQGNVEFNGDDNQWIFHCWICSCETPISNDLIPPELQSQRHKYSEHVLQSANVFQGSGRPKFSDRSE